MSSARNPLAVPRSAAPVPQWHEAEHRSHVVQFYAEDKFLIDALARIGTALGAGDAALVIATKAHRDALVDRLKANGLDTTQTLRQGRFMLLDAAEILSRLMVGGRVDRALFEQVVGGLITGAIAAAGGGASRVAAFGEMVALLWADGQSEAAIALEQYWNDLGERYAFSLHCAYPISGFSSDEHSDAFEKICAEHSAVLPDESYSSLKTEQERLRQIVRLQHRDRLYDQLRKAKTQLENEIVERITAETKLRMSEISLRELSGHLLKTQDEERRRLGRELHDSLGQYLAALKMSLEALRTAAASVEAEGRVDDCISLVDKSMTDVRTISYLLYPPLLEEMGLRTAVPWYLEGFAKRSGIQITFNISPAISRLPGEIELALFRVLQESLTNVHRHSESPTARISLRVEGDSAVLEVQDRGKGIPQAILECSNNGPWTFGVGLRGMHERVRQLGGTLQLSSSGSETVVRAIIPYPTIPYEGLAPAGNSKSAA